MPSETTVASADPLQGPKTAARVACGVLQFAFGPAVASIILFAGIRPVPGFRSLGDYVEVLFLAGAATWSLLAWLVFGRPAQQSVVAAVSCFFLGLVGAFVVFIAWVPET